ncbi:bactofilin family protein [Helicobacter felis]|uniref:bactofilin family protein n=1 Tax=Helicobacter felis TaxID=214 RepID=UPI00059DF0B9|nr:polymer-forming cytoskeletal protein [Helicobacter felis]
MAIFASDNKQPTNGSATIIAQSTKFKGEVNTDCHLHIDGVIEGSIQSSHTVVIGKNGVVLGDITASRLVVNGKLNGNAQAEVIEIMPLGIVDGKIVSSELIIERKGILIGESRPKENAHPLLENRADSKA